jgi:hypothetical protein
MLVLNPDHRIDAKGALHHPYFTAMESDQKRYSSLPCQFEGVLGVFFSSAFASQAHVGPRVDPQDRRWTCP